MTTKYHYNSDVFNRSVWFDPKNNKVFGHQDSGEPNESFVPDGSLENFSKKSLEMIDEVMNQTNDEAVVVKDGFDANQFDKIMDNEEEKYFSGHQPKVKETDNPLDDLIIKGNGDVAHSYIQAEKNPRYRGYTRSGYAGYYLINSERKNELLH